MNGKTVVWRVRVGKLYYVQGLHRFIKDSLQEHKNLEMTSYKEAAFLFPLEAIADNMAKSIDGVVERVELAEGEYSKLCDINEYHTKSKSDWDKYAYEGFIETIKKSSPEVLKDFAD